MVINNIIKHVQLWQRRGGLVVDPWPYSRAPVWREAWHIYMLQINNDRVHVESPIRKLDTVHLMDDPSVPPPPDPICTYKTPFLVV